MWLLCFLCFTSLVSAAGSYTKDEPKLFANIERLTFIYKMCMCSIMGYYYMACVCRWYNTRSDLLIVTELQGIILLQCPQTDYGLVCAVSDGKWSLPAHLLGLFHFIFVCHIINNLITTSVWLLWENLKPRPTVLTALLLGQYGEASVWDFPVTTSLSVISS